MKELTNDNLRDIHGGLAASTIIVGTAALGGLIGVGTSYLNAKPEYPRISSNPSMDGFMLLIESSAQIMDMSLRGMAGVGTGSVAGCTIAGIATLL